ncbi:CHAT domain-containing protein [Catellatospora citrea]|uniref:CHAT domain-containing protein n=1 Tax=Catellatospora citrea TaxID=53366 RepID=UPI0014773157
MISSYTTTRQALLHQQTIPTAAGAGTPAVGVADPPPIAGVRFAPLAAVATELDHVTCSAPAPRTVLAGDNARIERIRDALGSHHYLHFAYHGHQDARDPSASYRAVADGPLRVRDLADQNIEHAPTGVPVGMRDGRERVRPRR